ncbi:hypothetical protein GF336_03595 [Candidatus Woesearchaeota archaeon]|nr:hypothetical protein [Candidatus Woesearchaeota archaeon]
MKKIMISLVFMMLLIGCNGIDKSSSSESLYEKYRYDCANVVDHSTFDYDMQQNMIQECFDKCCGGEYCRECQWPGDTACYQECEDEKPEGTCVNCDGVCWEKGLNAYLKEKIAKC